MKQVAMSAFNLNGMVFQRVFLFKYIHRFRYRLGLELESIGKLLLAQILELVWMQIRNSWQLINL